MKKRLSIKSLKYKPIIQFQYNYNKVLPMQKINLLFKLLFLLVFTLATIGTNAQTGLNFQGVARSSTNAVLASQAISIKLTILQGSATGTSEYTETRKVTTNAQGLFTAVIGDAGAVSTTGNFATINWKLTPKFLKVEMDPAAGNNFTTMGTTQLQSVAYAQFANSVAAENVVGVLPVAAGGTGVTSISAIKTALSIDKVNNTADLDKPISTATQSALALKANASDVAISLATKVDKISGKDLSTNDYSTAEKTKLAAITGINTGDQDLSLYATTAAVTNSLATKVDKVTGKDLSTNDFTTAEKTKLAAITGINTGDQDLSLYATAASVLLKENQANKSTDALLGGLNASNVLFPTQKAVKDYVAANAASGGVADGGITNIKLGDLSVTDSKITDVAASKITGTLGVSHGGTGVTTLTGIVKANGTSPFTAATAGTDYLAPNGSAANLTSFPTLNQNTTGNAATATKLAATKNINGIAFDGSADIIVPAKFTNNVTINLSGSKSLGKYPNGATIPAAGKTLDEFLLDLVTESIHPTYTAPTVSISSDKSASYEIGTNIGTVTLSSSFNQNNGGAATSTTYFKNSVSLGAGVSTNNHGVLSTSISYSVTVTYGAGTVVLNDNLGNPDATGQIAAGSTSSSLTISPYANKYFGTSVSNSIDDATLLAGTNEVASGKAKSNFTIPISGGTKYIFYAYPASLGALSSISVEGFGSLDAFTLTTRNVTNASGYTQSYNIYLSNNNFSNSVNNIIIN